MAARITILVAFLILGVVAAPAGAQDGGGDPAPAPHPGTVEPDFTPEQQVIHDEVTALNAEVLSLFNARRYKKALPLAEKAYELVQKVHPGDHDHVASTMADLGAQYLGLQQWAPGIEWTRKALAMRERVWGPDAPQLIGNLNNLVAAYAYSGRHEEALEVSGRALAIAELTYGVDASEVIGPLRSYFVVFSYAERRAESIPHGQRLVGLMEKHDWDPAELAETRSVLRTLLQTPIDPRKMLEQERRAVAALEARGVEAEPALANALDRVARHLAALGRFDEAVAAAGRSLALNVAIYGEESRLAAVSRTGYSVILFKCDRFNEAADEAQRALAVVDRLVEGPHPERARARFHTAHALSRIGRLHEALPLVEEASRMFEEIGNAGSSDLSGCYNLQGLILREIGSFEESKRVLEHALEYALADEWPHEATIITAMLNLSGIRHSMRDFAGAAELLRATLPRAVKYYGEDHEQVRHIRSNLVAMEFDLGHVQKAAMMAREQLEAVEKRHGPDSLQMAYPLGHLAGIRASQGDIEESVELLQRQLSIYDATVGTGTEGYLSSLGLVVHRLGQLGRHDEALSEAGRALDLFEHRLVTQGVGLTDAQRRTLADQGRLHLSRYIVAADNKAVGSYDAVLRIKGLLARMSAAERRHALRTGGREDPRYEQLQAIDRQVARLANAYPRRKSERARWRRQYAAASAERERLARELAIENAALNEGLKRLDLRLDDVKAALGSDEVLVDYLFTNGQYIAWVVGPKDPMSAFPVPMLVRRADLEPAVEEFIRRSSDPATTLDDAEWRAAGRRLSDAVLAPIFERLGKGVKRLLVCPDGALSLVPFAALPVPGRDDRFLIDEYEIASVSMAQDLVPFGTTEAAGRGALVIGAVDYAKPGTGRAQDETDAPAPGLVAMRSSRGSGGRRFVPLPQTKLEVEALSTQMGKDAVLLAADEATEARLRRLARGKRFVHVATHGFVRDNLMAGLRKGREENEWLGAEAERRLAAGYDPLLLAGLALAGANAGDGGEGDDGILTAAEVSHLDLRGVELVTLSACDTARGHVAAGDGVVGLVQAFQMAGAHDVLASLWPVDDEATRMLMQETYAALLAGGDITPAAALRRAALALRGATGAKSRSFAGPAYWAAFGVYRRE